MEKLRNVIIVQDITTIDCEVYNKVKSERLSYGRTNEPTHESQVLNSLNEPKVSNFAPKGIVTKSKPATHNTITAIDIQRMEINTLQHNIVPDVTPINIGGLEEKDEFFSTITISYNATNHGALIDSGTSSSCVCYKNLETGTLFDETPGKYAKLANIAQLSIEGEIELSISELSI